MFETTAPPRSLRELFGTATLLVGATFFLLWIAVFLIATAMVLPLWQAGNTLGVTAMTIKAAAPLLTIGLFGAIFTLGTYGLCQNSARGR